MTSTESLVLDRAFTDHRHELYARLRTEAPVQRATFSDGDLPVYVVTRYADARFVLTDPRFGKDYRHSRWLFEKYVPTEQNFLGASDGVSAHMLNSDPPDHTRLRKLVAKAFTARRVENLRPRVEAFTAGLLDDVAGKPEVDLLNAVAFPLPITVISELLGVAPDEHGQVRAWTKAMLDDTSPEQARDAAIAMNDYLVRLAAEKRRQPADDLLSALIEASDDGDRLSEDELVAMVFLLLVAGHETTVNLIGNGVLSLLTNPDQFAALKADHGLVEAAVEETLRYESPVSMATFRHTLEAVQVGDVEIPEGAMVLVALGSGNRDHERYAEADRFDLARDTSGHLAFGHGIHFCLGASLARMEGRIALRQIVERFPDMELAVPTDDLQWRFSTLVRGLERLPIRPNA